MSEQVKVNNKPRKIIEKTVFSAVSTIVYLTCLFIVACIPVGLGWAFGLRNNGQADLLNPMIPLLIVFAATSIIFFILCLCEKFRLLFSGSALVAFALLITMGISVGLYMNSPAHACTKSNEHAEYVNGSCMYQEKVIVADQVFSYSDSYGITKNIDGKLVSGTEYVVEAGYDNGRQYSKGQKVFVAESDFKQEDFGGYYDTKNIKNYISIDSVFLFEGANGLHNKYVIHTKEDMLQRSIEEPHPNWDKRVELQNNETGNKEEYVYLGADANRSEHTSEVARVTNKYDKHVFWGKTLLEGE